ncbi:GNAT family N-acetyltransferase [Micromonospora sp. WMMA1949]|uniref:N-acetyltransferase n=1 Tax=Micromonospora echinospora TaxID=1877 RepID=A0A288VKB6_MICEC|nr:MULTISPECIES: GNAT family N-acetyltransferase [unclassified Micromonospora]ARD70883.1 N-acetyltransferase [Micromonospora echinospora]MCZ7428713.1 GNAT family N-acetyltransferase [Micromonospora sp. WMMA1949]WBC07584.1 GNAT family N-acetyltransferase [Micromonospora sp. WMMA1947]
MNWKIERETGADLDMEAVLGVYRSSGLGERRPIADVARMATMVRSANLIVTCRIEGELVGIARSVSDFSYVTYLSDIAVARSHQRSGIGKALIEATRNEAPMAKIVLLSAPAASDYYPHIGFTRHDSAWVLNP